MTEGQLIKIIEAIKTVSSSESWSTLKEEIFDPAFERIEGRIKSETSKEEINTSELYRLQGEKKIASRYHNLDTIAAQYVEQLKKLRTNPPTSGLT